MYKFLKDELDQSELVPSHYKTLNWNVWRRILMEFKIAYSENRLEAEISKYSHNQLVEFYNCICCDNDFKLANRPKEDSSGFYFGRPIREVKIYNNIIKRMLKIFLMSQINDSNIIINEKCTNSIFLSKNGAILFSISKSVGITDSDECSLFVNKENIWDVLVNDFSLNTDEIQIFIRETIKNIFKSIAINANLGNVYYVESFDGDIIRNDITL